MRQLMNTLLASLSLTIGANASQLAWTPSQIIKTKAIGDVQPSPDNRSVLFVSTEAVIGEEKGRWLSKIYKANADGTGEPTLFSPDQDVSVQPRWSPDGKWVAFICKPEKTRKLYLSSADGSSLTVLIDGKKDVQTFAWAPDSSSIAFVMEDEKENQSKNTTAAYIYRHPTTTNRLWRISIDSKQSPVPLTPDSYCVRGCGDFGTINTEFSWSPDGKTIVFAHSPRSDFDTQYLDSSIAAVDLLTGKISDWEKKDTHETVPMYSPDGKHIAYLASSSPEQYAFNDQVAVRDSNGEHIRYLAPTFNEGMLLYGPALLGWTQDGKNLLFFEPKRTRAHIEIVPLDGGSVKELALGNYFIQSPVLSYDRTTLGFVVQSTDSPPEACVAKIDPFEPVQISNLNSEQKNLPQAKTEVIHWKTFDGLEIEGLLTYPIGYQTGKKYPLLLVIHGGPMGVFEESFLGTPHAYPFASFAEAGFMILKPNPRGSCGYGEKFRTANYEDWGGGDFQDVMLGVDSLIDKGLVNSEKMGVMGWSYGGYLTAWTITQTNRFKLASAGAGLSNLISMAGTSDITHLITDYLRGSPIDKRDLYIERSPISHVHNVQTPCLIQHGTEDKRVPISQAYELYHALEREGKPVTLIIYPETAHRFPDPNMQVNAMEDNFSWFQKLLKED